MDIMQSHINRDASVNNDMNKLHYHLIKLRSDIFNGDTKIALENLDVIFGLIGGCKSSAVICEFLSFCSAQIGEFIKKGELKKAYDLTDCIHVIPDIIESPRKDLKEFWKIYVEKYMNDHNDFSLSVFKERILTAAL